MRFLQVTLMAVFVFVSFSTTSVYLHNWDAGQFALGTVRYSLQEHQPHPPGYFLFVQTAKALNAITHDVNQSYLLINIAASALAIVFLFLSIQHLSRKKSTAYGITILFAVNPIFWFYHSIAVTYVFEALAASFLLYTTICFFPQQRKMLPLSTFVVALLAGFRPPILIIASPFLLFQIFQARRQRNILAAAIASGLAGLVVWAPFFIGAAGGLHAVYSDIVAQFFVARSTAVYDIQQSSFLFWSILYALHVPLMLIMMRPKHVWKFLNDNRLLIIPSAIVWQILVYLGIHFGEVGYILAIVPLFYLFVIPVVESLSTNPPAKMTLLLFFMLLETSIFFSGVPFVKNHKLRQMNYQDIATHDERLKTYLSWLDQMDPQDTIVVMLRGQYLNPQKQVASYPYDDIRAMSYYAPEYTLYDLLGVPELYFTSHNYQYQQHSSSDVEIPAHAKHVLFFADYIYPGMLPSGLPLRPKLTTPSTKNVYVADIDGNVAFEYNGLRFRTMAKTIPQ